MPFFSINASKLLWSLFPIPMFSAMYLFSNNSIILINWSIFKLNSSVISLPLILDPWGCLFSATVLFISSNVMFFASSYMEGDKYLQRFSHLVLLFVLSMNLLIFIPNLICLLLGWDGLGIVSFVLVIYYQNAKSLAAGMITALMNRVGDVMILLSIALTLNLGHWSILTIWKDPYLAMISCLIMLAAMTKSAQIPFSSWLPAAMAAPTPVSALVHSSTLVTAGVFLIIRFHYVLSSIYFFNQILLIIASLTMFMAGMAAIAECDMKKIIALSTLSQLGVMMASLGLNLTSLAFFHLITHALFKALLFLTAGSMIHFHHHSQDLRFMGNLVFSSPLSISCLLIANLALCGSPFLAGFYSKDLIIEMALFNPTNCTILILFLLATALTASYSIRFMLSVVWNSSNCLPFQYTSDSTTPMTTPMIFLTAGAISGGASLNWLAFNTLDEPFLPPLFKLCPLIITLIGAFMAYFLTISPTSLNVLFPLVHFFNSSMWFLQPTTSQGIINTPLNLSHNFLKYLDHGWLELLGSQGSFSSFANFSKNMLNLSLNHITTHLSLFSLILFSSLF
uniref:NADH dehydrogenase subunit 5 n=1 Tax=Hyperhalosydna striata TaxID=1210421 RepID=UPI002008EBAD|nr:NADH dehydrogenase subunit 5 [Hyperhalosydna striata]QTZ18386.1 NADH dehydrogenase subunit 5 [Hyperhalosydna striata]